MRQCVNACQISMGHQATVAVALSVSSAQIVLATKHAVETSVKIRALVFVEQTLFVMLLTIALFAHVLYQWLEIHLSNVA